jgi:hypothetical protein
MAKKRALVIPPKSGSVTWERAERLHRLLQALSKGPQTRTALMRRLRLDLRGFYRDLETLRQAGIELRFVDERYLLAGKVQDAVARLPFPDPHLTLGEAILLGKGRSKSHAKLKTQIARILGSK